MTRRELIRLIGGAALAPSLHWPARAQQPTGTRRIGVLMDTVEDHPDGQLRVAALRKSLAELGWTESRNIRIELRWSGGNGERASFMSASHGGAAASASGARSGEGSASGKDPSSSRSSAVTRVDTVHSS